MGTYAAPAFLSESAHLVRALREPRDRVGPRLGIPGEREPAGRRAPDQLDEARDRADERHDSALHRLEDDERLPLPERGEQEQACLLYTSP
ncbi:MAG: hypothetical protein QUU85_04585, partial [Candidatus Eisenbacteria bacterium]|nr:hypothetical protein [Candidatus Eisenbacteria bacterium]